MTTTPLGPTYYRHSGRFSGSGALLALGGSAAMAVVLASVYAYLVLYIPVAGWITFAMAGGLGWLVGLAAGKLMIKGKVRSFRAAWGICLATAAVTYLTAWYVWIYALIRRDGGEVGMLDLLLNPTDVWQVVLLVNEKGAWAFKSHTPTGLELWMMWAGEAALICGPIFYVALGRVKALPFCEHCNRWGVARPLTQVDAGTDAAVRSQIEAGDFACLEKLGRASGNVWYEVSLEGCPDCDTTQTLCIRRCTLTYDRKGNAQTKTTKVVERLILSPEQVVQIAAVAAAVQVPKVTPDETPKETTVDVAKEPEGGAGLMGQNTTPQEAGDETTNTSLQNRP